MVDVVDHFMQNTVDRFSALQVFVGDLVGFFEFEELDFGEHFIEALCWGLLLDGEMGLIFLGDKFGEEKVVLLLHAFVHGLEEVGETSVSHINSLFL